MTLNISKETEALLEKALASGHFDSAEHAIQYALGRTLTEEALAEDEAFGARVKAALIRSEKAKEEGRVRTLSKEEHIELYEDVKRRGEERFRAGRDKTA